MPLEHARSILTEEERKRAREVVRKKSLRYFEDRNNRSFSEACLFTRRRNLSAHLGVDENVSKKDLHMINVHALPLPLSIPKERKHGSLRYKFQTNNYNKSTNQELFKYYVVV